MANWRSALGPFRDDERGAFAIIAAIAIPAAISAAVLGAEVGYYALQHQSMQGAADAAALSGVISKASGAALQTQAKGVAAQQGFVDGANGATVTVNKPPTSGAYTTDSTAVEVIVSQPQQPALAKFISSASINVRARAVARKNVSGGACVLSTKGAIALSGTSSANLSGCDAYSNFNDPNAVTAGGTSSLTARNVVAVGGIPSTNNITASGSIYGGASPATDPYATRTIGTCSGCTAITTVPSNGAFQPGLYKTQKANQGFSITASATFSPGTYYFASDVSITSGAVISGTGVTLVFLSGANLKVAGSVSLNLSAPTTGDLAGLVIVGDRNYSSDLSLRGGDSQQLSGAIYNPNGTVTYEGNASGKATCTQIIAGSVSLTGTSKITLDCGGTGVEPAGNQVAILVE